MEEKKEMKKEHPERKEREGEGELLTPLKSGWMTETGAAEAEGEYRDRARWEWNFCSYSNERDGKEQYLSCSAPETIFFRGVILTTANGQMIWREIY